MTSTNKSFSWLAAVNIILALVGYDFITTVFADKMVVSSQTITIPYRAFCLLVAILTIVFSKKEYKANSTTVKVLFVYWGFLVLRFFFDSVISLENHLDAGRVNQIWLYMICLSIIPMIAVVRSFRIINLDNVLFVSYILSSVSVFLTMLNNTAFQEATDQRVAANIALSTIGAGHMGLTNIVLGIFILLKKKNSIVIKAIIVFIGILGLLIMLRAGSRGPVLAFVGIIIFFLFSKFKSIATGSIAVLFAAVIAYISVEYIVDWIENISPILKYRLFDSDGDTSGRDVIYRETSNLIMNNPIIGNSFAIYGKYGNLDYPHNIFLESLLQVGILGFAFLLYFLVSTFKSAYILIHRNSSYIWLALLFIQIFCNLLVSGSLSMTPAFSILIVLVSLCKKYTLK